MHTPRPTLSLAMRIPNLVFSCTACVFLAAGQPGTAAAAAATEAASPAEARGAPVAHQVDAAMFQARRMLHALVRGDHLTFRAAHRELLRLEAEVRRTPGVDRAKLDALDTALTMAALSRSVDTARELQRAAQDVIASAVAPADQAP